MILLSDFIFHLARPFVVGGLFGGICTNVAINTEISNTALEGCLCLFIFHHVILYPRFLSPLRFVPGPPPGSPLCGQFPQRDLAEEYGPAVRVVGPVGIEILIVIRPSTLQKILVTNSADYPRVGSTYRLIPPLIKCTHSPLGWDEA